MTMSSNGESCRPTDNIVNSMFTYVTVIPTQNRKNEKQIQTKYIYSL